MLTMIAIITPAIPPAMHILFAFFGKQFLPQFPDLSFLVVILNLVIFLSSIQLIKQNLLKG